MVTIAVTGATGQLGRLVADQLLASTPPQDVVLLSRRPDDLSGYAARGATVRRADFEDAAGLPSAFAGIDRLLVVSTDQLGRQRVEAQGRAIEAARSAGVGLIAYTSLPRTDPGNPAGVAPDHAATEQLIRESGLTWTFLRNNLYADMQVDALKQAAVSGRWLTNTGEGATAYVTRADCAAVAVGVLTGTGHDDQVYEVTGPQAWDAHALAELAAELGGRPVEVVDVDDAAYAAGLRDAGLPAEVAELMTSFGTSTRQGYLGEVTDVVERVGRRPATSLRDLVL